MLFLITRASELKFFGIFLRKNESTSGTVDGKQGYTQTASERKIFKVMFKKLILKHENRIKNKHIDQTRASEASERKFFRVFRFKKIKNT